MTKPLDIYQKKRRFDNTPEPAADARPHRRRASGGQFVVQKHAASHLHYDFRLELDGSLKSWAVPKGPSLDPHDKRMAVHVEDHPLAYGDFEGVIPPGNYGAGNVIVWDRGEWQPLGDAAADYAAGKLKFELHGNKLRGRWTLVRTRQSRGSSEAWLLIKERDEEARAAAQFNIVEALPNSVLSGRPVTSPGTAARRADSSRATAKSRDRAKRTAPPVELPAGAVAVAQPRSIAPQLATLVKSPPRHGDWLYELKFDGYRVMSRIGRAGDVALFTRSGLDWTPKLRRLASALQELHLDSAWLDGEIVAMDSDGVPKFQLLQNAFETGSDQNIDYFIFDILYFRGHDLREVALRQRRALLRQLLDKRAAAPIRFSEDFNAPSEQLIEAACRLHFEGVIGKRADSLYQSARSPDWIKLKCTQRQEFIIGGFTDSAASSGRGIGALLLGVHDAHGKLRYAGKVGTGFTQQSLRELQRKLRALERRESPFDACPLRRNAHWVQPRLVAEIEFSEWTDDGAIRHASFQGLREDKPARAIYREQAIPVTESDMMSTGRTRNKTARASTGKPRAAPATAAAHVVLDGISLSHPERVIDTVSGITKLQLAQYYADIADVLLPHLRGRPVSLVRAPGGIDGTLFFQKHRFFQQHSESPALDSIRELDTALLPGHPPLLEITSREGLLACMQMNVIEFHTWNATTRHIEQPDRMLFDLDPGEGIVWPQMIEAAQLMRELLDRVLLRSFIKTSGGKGLHIVVPLKPQADWDSVKDFSAAIARYMAATLPQLFVAKSGPSNRIGRIFIDYLRNTRGATTVAAFCARARPGLGVSMPFAWDDLAAISGGAHWHIDNVDAQIAEYQQQSWKGYTNCRQTLTRARRLLPQPN